MNPNIGRSNTTLFMARFVLKIENLPEAANFTPIDEQAMKAVGRIGSVTKPNKRGKAAVSDLFRHASSAEDSRSNAEFPWSSRGRRVIIAP